MTLFHYTGPVSTKASWIISLRRLNYTNLQLLQFLLLFENKGLKSISRPWPFCANYIPTQKINGNRNWSYRQQNILVIEYVPHQECGVLRLPVGLSHRQVSGDIQVSAHLYICKMLQMVRTPPDFPNDVIKVATRQGKYFLWVRELLREFWYIISCQGSLSRQVNHFLIFLALLSLRHFPLIFIYFFLVTRRVTLAV